MPDNKILEGLWDCPYCKSTAIGGLTKHCPCCGHPQDEGTKFYLGEKKNYLQAELAGQYGKGADWVCPFCGSLNRVHYQYCSNCAAGKENAEKDYFSAKKAEESQQEKPAQTGAQRTQPQSSLSGAAAGKKGGGFLKFALLALAALLVFMFWPRTYEATVTASAWARQVDIEACRTVQESGWSVPSGGRVYEEKSEIHHYEDVLDHYETRTREVPEQVYDGEDTHTRFRDNGDGTFTEETYTTPRYRTDWHTETYQQPIYRKEPVYATRYYYNIDRWMPERTEKSSGTTDEPYWPNFTLGKNEREGQRYGTYVLDIKAKNDTYRVRLSQEEWSRCHVGDKVKITVVSGEVTKINDRDVR